MAKVSPIDYKRVSSLPWQTLNIEIPDELVVPKGNSSQLASGAAPPKRG